MNAFTPELLPNTKYVPLTKGFKALVDEHVVIEHKYYLGTSHRGARIDGGKRTEHKNGKDITHLLHRDLAQGYIFGYKGEKIDHINGNTLDNRLCNLRPVTHRQNELNKKRKPGKSGYVGVKEKAGKYIAAVCFMGRSIHLGSFDTPKDAAKAYDLFSAILGGDYAKASVNFPKNFERYKNIAKVIWDNKP